MPIPTPDPVLPPGALGRAANPSRLFTPRRSVHLTRHEPYRWQLVFSAPLVRAVGVSVPPPTTLFSLTRFRCCPGTVFPFSLSTGRSLFLLRLLNLNPTRKYLRELPPLLPTQNQEGRQEPLSSHRPIPTYSHNLAKPQTRVKLTVTFSIELSGSFVGVTDHRENRRAVKQHHSSTTGLQRCYHQHLKLSKNQGTRQFPLFGEFSSLCRSLLRPFSSTSLSSPRQPSI